MRSQLRDAFLVGAITGILFYLNALVPRSYLYPLAWPFLGGGLTIYVLARGSTGLISWVKTFAIAGAVSFGAGLFFLLPGLGTLYALSHVSVPQIFSGAVMRPVSTFDRAQAVNSVIIAIVAIPAAAVAGTVLVRSLLIPFQHDKALRHHAQPA